MSSNLDVILKEIGMKYEDAGDCRGTNVILHKAIERIATHKKIKFDEPKFLECNTEKKIVSLMVTGTLGDKSEWSIEKHLRLIIKTTTHTPWQKKEPKTG